MSLRGIIIDDEKGGIDALLWELEVVTPTVEVVATTQNPLVGIALIKEHKPDVVFLDIQMPEMNGFDLLAKFDKIDFEVIFITAYDEFALKAFRVSAVDFLLKPVDEDSLRGALEKITNKKQHGFMSQKLEVLIENLRQNDQQFNTIALPSSDGLDFIDISDIIRCQSDSNYTEVHLQDKTKIVVSKTLKDIENLLPDNQFFRVHNSHLINLKFIKKYRKGNAGSIVLSDDSVIPVSRTKKNEFLNNF